MKTTAVLRSPGGIVLGIREYRTISRTRWALCKVLRDEINHVVWEWVRCDALTAHEPVLVGVAS